MQTHKLNKILVILDPRHETQPSVQRAITLAETIGKDQPLEVELLCICFNASLESEHFFDATELSQARQSYCNYHQLKYESLVKQLEQIGVKAELSVIWKKHCWQAICSYAEQSHSDLVIKTTYHHNVMQRILFTPTDWHLLRDCHIPLWLAKSENIQHPINVACAVDPTQAYDKPDSLDQQIVAQAGLLGSLVNQLHLIHCYDPIPPNILMNIDALGPDDYSEPMKQHHQKAFEAFCAPLQNIPTRQQHLLQGDTYQTLPSALQEFNCHLLIMGRLHRSTMERIFIGSTAERLLEAVDTDILVMPAYAPK